MEQLVKSTFDVRRCFVMSLPAAYFLYIATNILQERKRFQAHLNQIRDQSWLYLLSFTLFAVGVI